MQQPATILLTGATGFIGQHLVKRWLAQGHRILALTRHRNRKQLNSQVIWFHCFDDLQPEKIDYVVNLAGENIGAKRWTQQRKQQLIHSRVDTTQNVLQWLSQHALQPRCIVSGSAIGYYGIDASEQWFKVCDEHDAPQAIFMSQLCQRWEQVLAAYPQFNVKVMRLGIVLAADGGILPQMLRPIQLNVVGKIGHGRQPITWVHLQDLMRAIEFLWQEHSRQQVFNVVAPEQISQADFAHTASRLLKRRPFFSAPARLLRWLLGEQSQLILNGQYVAPNALTQAGFQFQYPTLNAALQQILR